LRETGREEEDLATRVGYGWENRDERRGCKDKVKQVLGTC